MNKVNEQRELANDIADAISNPSNFVDVDEVSTMLNNTCISHESLSQDELKAELDDLEQDELNERLMGADHVPIHAPAGSSRVEECQPPFPFIPRVVSDFLFIHSTAAGSSGRRRGSTAQGTASSPGHDIMLNIATLALYISPVSRCYITSASQVSLNDYHPVLLPIYLPPELFVLS